MFVTFKLSLILIAVIEEYYSYHLAGILTLALFIHNAIITIMSNNEHQENNVNISICV